MNNSELLKQVLDPLLEDYHYWFDRSQELLESGPLEVISAADQSQLLAQVRDAQAELRAAESLYRLSENEVGIDPKLMAKWHRLLMACADLGLKYRQHRYPAE
ncbi:MAG: DUF2605 domain-containing protein [Synechococcaceae cyanobacterium SM2_3_1]|nr:DUF2605 domain-containing protein [Synechococcaceae cyanobacterium SM2_3_1]